MIMFDKVYCKFASNALISQNIINQYFFKMMICIFPMYSLNLLYNIKLFTFSNLLLFRFSWEVLFLKNTSDSKIIILGIGIGTVFGCLIIGHARNPSLKQQLFSYAILGFALSEAMGLFCLMIAFLMLFAL